MRNELKSKVKTDLFQTGSVFVLLKDLDELMCVKSIKAFEFQHFKKNRRRKQLNLAAAYSKA